MSPLNSSRKRKNRSGTGAGAAQPEDVFRDIIRGYRDLAQQPDPLDVEVYTSTLLGSLWTLSRMDAPAAVPGSRINGPINTTYDDTGYAVVDALISFTSGQRSREALALLRALEVMAESPEQRDAAGAAAATVAARGVPEPPWSGQAGQVTVQACWCLENVYGDDLTVFTLFDSGAGQQAIVTLLDYSELDGWMPESFVVDDPTGALDLMRQDAEASDGFSRLREITPSHARALIEEGVANTDALTDVTPSENFMDFRALTLARCRAMPAPAVREPVPEQRRAEIVTEFLGSPEAAELPGDPGVGELVRSIVDFGCAEDRGQPERVSPAKLDILLDELAFADEDQGEELITDVVLAWVRWVGARNELPPAAIEELVDVVEHGGLSRETLQTLDLIMEGLHDITDEDELRDAVERRMFAMPFSSTRIGDEEYPDLDPNDPDHRHLLVVGSHPEFHSVLDDPFAEDVTINGINPRTWLAAEEAIVNQLWDNVPPRTWEAAKRLIEQGIDRTDILGHLGTIWVRHLSDALTEEMDREKEQAADGQTVPEPLDPSTDPRTRVETVMRRRMSTVLPAYLDELSQLGR